MEILYKNDIKFEKVKIGELESSSHIKYAAYFVSIYGHNERPSLERKIGRIEVIAKTDAGIITQQAAYEKIRGLSQNTKYIKINFKIHLIHNIC